MLRWVERDALYDQGVALVQPVSSVMDIGSGLRPQAIVNSPRVLVCVEVHDEYIAELRRRFAGTTTLIIQGRVPECLGPLPDRCIDTVMMLDFIEHLEREDGLRALQDCERLARRQVVLFTPLGFMPQDDSGETDGWGLQGTYWQTHRSGWVPEDFDDRWHVVACRDFHHINGKGEPLPEPFGALWAVLNIDGQPTDACQEMPVEEMASGEAINVLASGLRQREIDCLAKEIELRRREKAIEPMERWQARLARLRPQYWWRQMMNRREGFRATDQGEP